MVHVEDLPHPIDIEVGRYRAGSQDGVRQKEGEKHQLHDVVGSKRDLRIVAAFECGLLVFAPVYENL